MNTPDHDKPPRVRPRLTQSPKVRDLYWCDFPRDAQLPEFWKRRPVIVVASDRAMSGAVTVIPCSSQQQIGNRWAVSLTTTIDGLGPSWAICDKPTTVAISRLSLDKRGKCRLSQAEFTLVLARLLQWLPGLAPSGAAPLDSAPPDGPAVDSF